MIWKAGQQPLNGDVEKLSLSKGGFEKAVLTEGLVDGIAGKIQDEFDDIFLRRYCPSFGHTSHGHLPGGFLHGT